MGKKSKLAIINETKEARLNILPDGNIYKELDKNIKFRDFRHGTRTNLKRIYFDLHNIHDYDYNIQEGVIVPYNRILADSIIQKKLKAKAARESDLLNQYTDFIGKLAIEVDENRRVKYISSAVHQEGGGQMVEDGKYVPTVGRFFNKLGGMKYSYGIELETAAGKLTFDDLVYSNTSMQGDRTITGYEYVTNIFAGDAGLDNLKILAEAIQRRTVIGEQNGLHIHIGGMPAESSIWTPAFNRLFSINAIKLGVQIEDEMYGLLFPPRREDRFLKSIKEWGNINGTNWRDVLGDYVFKGSDDIFRPYDRYETHVLDERHNANFQISRWAKTKNKWLNLNHCNANSHVNTVEFRLYSATGSYHKIYNFLLLSLAIVWFIEHRQRLIWDGKVTLYTIVQEAYDKRGYPDIAEGLHQFINKRELKFKN